MQICFEQTNQPTNLPKPYHQTQQQQNHKKTTTTNLFPQINVNVVYTMATLSTKCKEKKKKTKPRRE